MVFFFKGKVIMVFFLVIMVVYIIVMLVDYFFKVDFRGSKVVWM